LLKNRLIPVLILRDGQVVQSVQFKHTNVIHWNPVTAVDFFNKWAVDEIILLDVSRKLAKRKKFYDAVTGLSKKCFVPLTVGGWITEVSEAKEMLRIGADKIVINTEAFRRPQLIADCAKVFGSQCVVISIDVKQIDKNKYEVYINRGKEPTGITPVDWAKRSQDMGAGEIFLNCIDRDGFRKGYDLELLTTVVDAVRIPVIAMGGVFKWEHLLEGIKKGGADAVAAANIFHYTEQSTKKAKKFLKLKGIDVR
jgi:cyclase